MRMLVWGTGRLAGKVVGRYIDINDVTAFIDNDVNKKEYMGRKVLCPEEAAKTEYDVIVVANLFQKEIRNQCEILGIDLKKVIFLYSNCVLKDVNEDYDFVESILGKEYSEIIRCRYHMVRGVEAYGDLCLKSLCVSGVGYIESDYVRIKCFELAVKEIRKKNIEGNVAEVGVFRGEFAQFINLAFPDRKCYLFDTFDGFDANEALNEVKNGNCTEAFVQAYKQTDVGMVLQKMKYLESIIIKQGFFPESLDGLEDTFVFVSIDVDFEDSIYEGLKYFYPRMEKGGYIICT